MFKYVTTNDEMRILHKLKKSPKWPPDKGSLDKKKSFFVIVITSKSLKIVTERIRIEKS